MPHQLKTLMTEFPHTISADGMLSFAREQMNAHRIRHLPVLDGGRLVGLLSQREKAHRH